MENDYEELYRRCEAASMNRSNINLGDTEETLAAGFISDKRVRLRAVGCNTPYLSLLYLIRGRGQYVDAFNQVHDLSPGSLCLRLPDRTHDIYRDDDSGWLEFFLLIPCSAYQSLLKSGILSSQLTFLQPGLDYYLIEQCLLFAERFKVSSPMSFWQHLLNAQELLLDMFLLDDNYVNQRMNSHNIVKACHIITASVGDSQELVMPDVARQVGMGYELFRKTFKEEVGLSPKEYMIVQRIEKAKQYLEDYDYTLQEVAELLSYPDMPSFAKQFRKVVKTTPRAYQKSRVG